MSSSETDPEALLKEVSKKSFALSQQRKFDEAAALLKDRLLSETDPRRRFVLSGMLGSTFMTAGKYAEAVTAFDALIQIAPDNPIGYFKKGSALSHMVSSVVESVELLDKSISLGYTEPDIYYALGFAHKAICETGRGSRDEHYPLALKAFSQVLEKDPQNYAAISNIADIHYNMGEIEEALVGYLKVNELAPGNATTLMHIAHVYMNRGENEKSLEYLVLAEKCAGNRATAGGTDVRDTISRDLVVSIHTSKGEIYHRMGRTRESRKELREVIALTDGKDRNTASMERCRAHAQKSLAALN